MWPSLSDIGKAAAVVAVLLILVALSYWNKRRNTAKAAKLKAREVAAIVETVDLTPLGKLAALGMLAFNLAAFAWFGAATTAFNQITIASVAVAGNVVLAAGMIMGRRRTYLVYRAEQRQEAE